MGIILLILLLTLEAVFLFWSVKTKNLHREEKSILSISLLALLLLLLFTGVFQWSFRYVPLFLILSVQALAGARFLMRRKVTAYGLSRSVLRFTRNSILFTAALFVLIVFPQYDQPQVTGDLAIAKTKYTWTDEHREDPFSTTGAPRSLTVEFWYPETPAGDYPLIVFSHGAFGFSGSNYSTFAELASNGYVVASIGHTGHAFYTLDTKNRLTTVDSSFITRASEINAVTDTQNEEDIFETTREWMSIRTQDENFVLDTILTLAKDSSSPLPFSIIQPDRIGLMGHSLGGAASAQTGRDRSDIDAVIVLDGTMLGEEIAFGDQGIVLNDTPYPVPLLNIYAEDHYENARTLEKDSYSNFHASENALNAYETVFRGAGHLNFTDLPLFSPMLAGKLGIGTVDERSCIETMNEVVLSFFNSCLKEGGSPKIEKEY